MKRLATAVLVILGMAVSSGGLAQSVKFAIGQTWTGTFQGSGTWSAKFTELDKDGDPRGPTISGPDKRVGGGFYNRGLPVYYVTSSAEALYCIAATDAPQVGVYKGTISKAQGGGNAQDTGAACTFQQVNASSSQVSSSQGGGAWPPSARLSAGAMLRFEGRQVWALSITAKDSDGDWTGKATGADGKTATVFSYSQDDGSFVFQLAIQNANGASEYCELQRSGAGASGYAGTRYYKANKDAKPQTDGQCKVTFRSSQGPDAAVWPPSNLLGVDVAVRVEMRSVWVGTFTGQDKTDWVGKVTSPSGLAGKVYGYLNDNGTYEFQVVNTPATGTQYEYCTLQKNGSQVAPGVYVGKRFFAPNKDADAAPDGDCRVAIGATSSQSNPNPQPQPSPQPQPNPVGPALAWPSVITVGQTWRVEISGAQAATFTLNLTGLDEFETPSGKVGAQTISMFPSRSQESTVIEIIGQPGAPIISCTFKGASSVRGQSLVGGKVQTRGNRGSLPVEQVGTCEATLVSGGSAAAVTPAPAPAPVNPAPVVQTSTPPVTTAWPLKLEVGQSWRAEIQGAGSWNVNFKILDRDGYPQGSAVPNGSGATLEAAFFYFQNDNDMRLKLTSGDTLYRCIFERNEINGLTFSGWRYVDSADGKSLDKTAQRCTMTFIGRVTLSSLVDPLAGFTSSLAASHSSN